MSESSPLLPRTNTSRISTSSSGISSQTGSKRPLSRFRRASEVQNDPNLAHISNQTPMLPAAPVDPTHETDLHDPKWAHHEGDANAWARFRYVWREELAECLGTAFIILFGASVECQTTLHYSNSLTKKTYSFGDYNSCRLAWAAGVACGIFVAGGISGAHINPTVTVSLWLFRGFPGRKVLWYILAQILGATLATFIVYSNYRFSIGLYEGNGLPSSIRTVIGDHATAPLFFTFPQPWLPASSAFLSEFLASAVLVCVIFALGDKSNLPCPKGTMAFAMFIVLVGIGASMGVNTGYALNGARDLGPRIGLWFLGYGNKVFTHDSFYWLYAPWIGAISGGCFGGLIYDLFIYTGKDSWINRPIGGTSNPKVYQNVNEETLLEEADV